MDRISQLSDDLLIKIVSLVETRDAVTMSILSKRWKSLWTLVPRLIFGDYPEEREDEDETPKANENHCINMSQFVYGTLLLHKAPVLECFHLNRASGCSASEIDLWVRIAIDRFVRDLTIDEESFVRLISNSPVLEDLVVETCHDDNVATFTINVPSLESLSIRNTLQDLETENDLFVVHYHCLKQFTIVDYFGQLNLIGNMPRLVEANLLSVSCQAKVLQSFTRVKRLSLCLPKEYPYPTGTVLSQLLALNHLMCEDRKVCWIQPSSVPECLLYHLKTLEWRDYAGTEVEKEVAVYILKNARRLETATINPDSDKLVQKHQMFEELEIASRGSRALIKSLHLKLHRECRLEFFINPLDNPWVDLSEVSIESCYASPTLPLSLRSKHWTLKTLILKRLSFSDTDDNMWFESLKTLHLLSVRFSDDISVQRLLTFCPKLEDLVVRRTTYVNVKIFTINVPSLRSLSIDYSWVVSQPVDVHGFVIKTPSLRYLNIKDYFSNFLQFENMPQLVKANIEVDCDQSEKFIGSITSIQHLSLCSKTSKIPYPSGTSFFYLEHLELCTCSQEWWNLLNRILKDAPRLQALKLKLKHFVRYNTESMDHWNEPCSVPKCLSSHLEICEWRHYKGTKQERKVAKYILAKASCLKMAIFSSVSIEKNLIFKELENVARGSEAYSVEGMSIAGVQIDAFSDADFRRFFASERGGGAIDGVSRTRVPLFLLESDEEELSIL
ncbi:Leucine-rich repeat 2 [Arabidopsis thaliana x Arabidopsis arenosa]|uniref:Leucine-rich repeat 2 n=1 Tax=Arabidopsis thaliana x Arabidopsis arenosa TaxID=1240361 RepID=A0A8T1XI44_9BRAS|nr:Leucine-rich repeat 2 [Arabidopsis thaliana x Arabidopsis arenosa]